MPPKNINEELEYYKELCKSLTKDSNLHLELWRQLKPYKEMWEEFINAIDNLSITNEDYKTINEITKMSEKIQQKYLGGGL